MSRMLFYSREAYNRGGVGQMEGRFPQRLADGGDGGVLDALSCKKLLLNPQGGLNIRSK